MTTFTDGQIFAIDYYNQMVFHKRNEQWEEIKLSYRDYMDCVVTKTIMNWTMIDHGPTEDGKRIQSEVFITSTKRRKPPKYIMGEQIYKNHKVKIERMKALRQTTKAA